MFIPLMKADATQRLVFGSIDETPDRSGEVLDYATARPAFEAWSKTFVDATDGKSLGNVRAQHDMKKACGKLVELTFDDDAKRINFVAKIVDDQEWEKVEEGVYTGFSPGGRYTKRWQDGQYRRYTPGVSEMSIVDIPCIPSGTFTMVKADGAEEEVPFILSKAYEPGNEATRERADVLAKAAGKGDRARDFLVQARADLIAENAEAELTKMAEADAPEPAVEPEPGAEPAAPDALTAALEKADAALAAAEPAAEVPAPFADLAKAADALDLITASPLAKSLWTTEWLNRLLRDFADLQSSVTWEEKYDADGGDMSIPAQAAKIVKAIGDLLVTMTQEGVADLLTCIQNTGVELVIEDGDAMELATAIVDLVKADTYLMEKAGARNSKSDAATIQSMHDGAVKLGATCDTSAEKVAELGAENERLTKAVESSLPRLEKLSATVERLRADNAAKEEELIKLRAEPAPPKGAVREVSKEADNGTLAKAGEDAEPPINPNLSPSDQLVVRAQRRLYANR